MRSKDCKLMGTSPKCLSPTIEVKVEGGIGGSGNLNIKGQIEKPEKKPRWLRPWKAMDGMQIQNCGAPKIIPERHYHHQGFRNPKREFTQDGCQKATER